MDYKEKYKKALERAKKLYEQGTITESLGYVFPELKDEDERIRKAIHIYLDWLDGRKDYAPKGNYSIKDMIAWLEKQGEQKKVSIWKHWKNGIAGNGEGRPVYLIKAGNTYTLSSVLSFECDYIELSELDNLMLEKQGEKKPTDKVEPKFKVRDWIVDKSGHIQQVLDFRCGIYTCTHNSFTIDCESNYHLWTIEDAMDGDVLIKEETGEPFIHNGNRGSYIPEFLGAYCGIDNGEFKPNGSPYYWGRPTCPATKEQRDLLFQKMKEAGYEWDSEKKELKKIEVASKESEDERIRLEIRNFIWGYPDKLPERDKWLAWFEKQKKIEI